MMRLLYAAAWILATPLAFVRLLWRARRQPGYREKIGERFGRYAPVAPGRRIWVHAVSVGETRAAAPVIEALALRFPGHRLLLTHMTPTGRATGQALFGNRVERVWLPYDLRCATRRFIARFRPEFGLVLETEIWPRLLEECRRAGIPVLLANARLSERSAARYARVPALTAWAFGNLAGIAAQTESDTRRFEALGARDVTITGNVKFDIEIAPAMLELGRALRTRFGAARRVLVAGSTREGEEALLLDAFALALLHEALLVLVPRHPQRFDAVADLATARGFSVARRSADAPVPSDVRVVIGDSMGEMPAYYAAADVVIMGGSLLPFGSQNLIEACSLGRPVVVGPSTYNFEEAAEGAIAAGAAVRVRDATEAVAVALEVAGDAIRREEMGMRGRAFVAAHRGAVNRLMAWIERRVGAKAGA